MKSEGFTIIELAVVTTIITLLSAVLLARLHTTQSSRLIRGAAQKLALNIRKTQNMAISTQESGGNVPCGYGLYFNGATPGSYILFADWDSDPDCANINRLYNGSEKEKEFFFPSRVEIQSVTPDPVSIFFLPPDPETSINYPSPTTEAVIIIGTAQGDQKKITINKEGGVEIE